MIYIHGCVCRFMSDCLFIVVKECMSKTIKKKDMDRVLYTVSFLWIGRMTK